MDDDFDKWVEKMPTWLVVVLGVMLAVLFIWGFTYSYTKSHARDSDPRYTIGYVTGTDYVIGPSSHSVAFFTYTVGDSTYHESSSGDVAEDCTRCLVKYAATDPHNLEFFNKICIPDEVHTAPAQGWTTPPFEVPDQVLH